jgi:hypothetical protein
MGVPEPQDAIKPRRNDARTLKITALTAQSGAIATAGNRRFPAVRLVSA